MPVIYIIVGLVVGLVAIPVLLLMLASFAIPITLFLLVLPIILILLVAYGIGWFVLKKLPRMNRRDNVVKVIENLYVSRQGIFDLVEEGMISESEGQTRLRELFDKRDPAWEEFRESEIAIYNLVEEDHPLRDTLFFTKTWEEFRRRHSTDLRTSTGEVNPLNDLGDLIKRRTIKRP